MFSEKSIEKIIARTVILKSKDDEGFERINNKLRLFGRFFFRFTSPIRVVDNSKRIPGFFLDGDYTFVIAYRGLSTCFIKYDFAVCSFRVSSDSKSITIMQLQGRTYPPNWIVRMLGWVPRDFFPHVKQWERQLVGMVEKLADNHDISEVHILPSEENSWNVVRDTQRGYLRYDKVAKRLGYIRKTYWTKALES